ncbi:hypothetical protein LXL04_007659 [Taraxacum kok-saghyz]
MEAMTVDLEEGSLKQEEVGSSQSRQNVPLSFASMLRDKFRGELFFHEVDLVDVLPPPVNAHRALWLLRLRATPLCLEVPGEECVGPRLCKRRNLKCLFTDEPWLVIDILDDDTVQTVGWVIKGATELYRNSGKQTVENVSVPTVTTVKFPTF